MDVEREIFVYNNTFWNTDHKSYAYIFFNGPRYTYIDGLKFENIVGSMTDKINSLVVVNMQPDSTLIFKGLEVKNTAVNAINVISI